jgi:hypothetical protein
MSIGAIGNWFDQLQRQSDMVTFCHQGVKYCGRRRHSEMDLG